MKGNNSNHEPVAGSTKEIAEEFGKIAAQLMLRDTLLPKLLSGELRVKQAEKELASHG
jgi:hypothetical protein